jgi:hypothetical protein
LRPDLLNTHFLTGYGYWGHYSGFHPNVLTVWGDDVYVTPFESALKNRLARAALRGCDALTGDSADILAVSATLGADPARSFRVLWGVDFEVFRPADADAWRRARGVARRRRGLLLAAQLHAALLQHRHRHCGRGAGAGG